MPAVRSVAMITAQKRVLHIKNRIYALIALLNGQNPPPVLIHLTQTAFRGYSWLVLRSSFIIPRICRQRSSSRARHRCAVALATFSFHKGRASAALRKILPSWLVDVHHHESSVVHFQVSPCVGGRPESHSVTTKTPSTTVAWGRATEPSVPRWRRQIPIFCRPKDSRRRKSVPTTANASLKPAGSFKLHDRPTRRRPFASERSPVSSLDLLKRAISLHNKEICTIREG